jgi:hypothetical protein
VDANETLYACTSLSVSNVSVCLYPHLAVNVPYTELVTAPSEVVTVYLPCEQLVNVCLPRRSEHAIATHLPEPGWPISRIFFVAARRDDMVSEG